MIMVGNPNVVEHMVDNNIVSKRYTGLTHFLLDEAAAYKNRSGEQSEFYFE